MQDESSSKSTVFVRNIPFEATRPVRQCFVVYDRPAPSTISSESTTSLPITNSNVKRKNKGFGFVHFSLPEDAQRAITELKSKQFKGDRKLRIDLALKRASKEDRANKRKRIDNVTNKVTPEVTMSEETDDIHIETVVEEVKSVEPVAKKLRPTPTITRVIVRNLTFKCRKQDLVELFSKHGKVSDVVVPRKWEPDGPFRGFAIIHYVKRRDAEAAMRAINGTDIMERTVAVDWCLPKTEYTPDAVVSAMANAAKDARLSKTSRTKDNAVKMKKDVAKNETKQDKRPMANMNASSDESDDDIVMDTEEASEDDEDEDEEENDEENESKDHKNTEIKDKSTDKSKNKTSSLTTPQDGTTMFIRNLAFDTDEKELSAHFASFGKVKYAVITKDKDTTKSRGTGFVCFADKKVVDDLLERSTNTLEIAHQEIRSIISHAAGHASHTSIITPDLPTTISSPFMLNGRLLSVARAVSRNQAAQLTTKDKAKAEKQDKRNLYLLREGVVFPDTPAAASLTSTELQKRQSSYSERKQLLNKNLNLYISSTRLSIRNLPADVDEKRLRALARSAVSSFKEDVVKGDRPALEEEEELAKRSVLKQVKVVCSQDRIDPVTKQGKSKGYGFVEFDRHAHALACLRYLNNNPSVFGVNKRPFVEFAVENKTIVRMREEKIKRNVKRQQDQQNEAIVIEEKSNHQNSNTSGQGRTSSSAQKLSISSSRSRGRDANYGSSSSRGRGMSRGMSRDGSRGGSRGSSRGGSSRGTFRGKPVRGSLTPKVRSQ